jgi:hypothetical protein
MWWCTILNIIIFVLFTWTIIIKRLYTVLHIYRQHIKWNLCKLIFHLTYFSVRNRLIQVTLFLTIWLYLKFGLYTIPFCSGFNLDRCMAINQFLSKDEILHRNLQHFLIYIHIWNRINKLEMKDGYL